MSVCLDPDGFPQNIVTGATGTGTGQSIQFTVLPRVDGGARNLWLQSKLTGTFTAFKVDLQISFDGGTTWSPIQSGMDLLNSPAQAVSPAPPVGALMRLNVSTFTGGTSANVLGSSN